MVYGEWMVELIDKKHQVVAMYTGSFQECNVWSSGVAVGLIKGKGKEQDFHFNTMKIEKK